MPLIIVLRSKQNPHRACVRRIFSTRIFHKKPSRNEGGGSCEAADETIRFRENLFKQFLSLEYAESLADCSYQQQSKWVADIPRNLRYLIISIFETGYSRKIRISLPEFGKNEFLIRRLLWTIIYNLKNDSGLTKHVNRLLRYEYRKIRWLPLWWRLFDRVPIIIWCAFIKGLDV